jgi:hypothetical protein
MLAHEQAGSAVAERPIRGEGIFQLLKRYNDLVA